MAKTVTDTEAILKNVDIIEVISKYVNLTKRGRDYVGLCEFHDDTSESMEVSERKQIYKCFACGAGGDAIDYLTRQGKTFFEAVKELTGGEAANGATAEKREAKKKKPVTVWRQIKPVPAEAFQTPPAFNHYLHGTPSHVWEWKNEAGEINGYTCRFDTPEGKEVLPYIYATDGKACAWRWQGFEKLRPLYNLDLIKANPEKTIIVLEGEKTADAGTRLINSAICVTWLGGANGVHLTDWSPLEGRKVAFWPDNDPQGFAAMLHINEILAGKTELSKWVNNPAGAPKHFDLADVTWNPTETIKYLRQNAVTMPEAYAGAVPGEIVEKAGTPVKIWHTNDFGNANYYGYFKAREVTEWRFVQTPRPVLGVDPEMLETLEPETETGTFKITPAPEIPEGEESELDEIETPFKFLGFNKSESGGLAFYFYVIRPKTVVRLSTSGMAKKAALMQLAPLDWWEDRFTGKQGMNIDGAVNWLISGGMAVGPYKDNLVRGRGAWLDSGRVILHAGGHLIVNGAPVKLGSIKTKYIYEWGAELGFNTYNPVKTAESRELLNLLSLLNWEREINAYLLAGWCVLAPVCGALTWRPHIWLTGAAGTGKSWVFNKIVRELCGETALAVQGEATEAGVRQTLGSDALPVVFDEAEGENQRAQARMQTILGLMRSASSSDGGAITKGTGNGVAKTYRIRSCFAFASIAVQVVQQSDRSRVTVLGLRRNDGPERAENWKLLQEKYNQVFAPGFVDRLQARTIALLPVITENARVFSAAAAAELGEQRSGDQIGTLLAGAFSLTSEAVVTYEKALAWLRSKDWTEEKGLGNTKDETACLTYLFEQTVRVETSNEKTLDRTIGELLEIAANITPLGENAGISIEKANERLRRFGIKLDAGYIVVSNTSEQIKRALAPTQWANNHNKILLRVEGAEARESTKFGGAVRSRAVAVPLDIIRD